MMWNNPLYQQTAKVISISTHYLFVTQLSIFVGLLYLLLIQQETGSRLLTDACINGPSISCFNMVIYIFRKTTNIYRNCSINQCRCQYKRFACLLSCHEKWSRISRSALAKSLTSLEPLVCFLVLLQKIRELLQA